MTSTDAYEKLLALVAAFRPKGSDRVARKMHAKLAPIWPCEYEAPAPVWRALNNKNEQTVKLFAALKMMREFERLELPFITSLIDFDIIIAVGFAEEEEKPLTPKSLFLLKISSVTTVRRRLAKLTEQGMVTRRTDAKDRRSDILNISPSSLKLLGRYGSVLGGISL